MAGGSINRKRASSVAREQTGHEREREENRNDPRDSAVQCELATSMPFHSTLFRCCDLSWLSLSLFLIGSSLR